jgi:hypothetical protein
LAGIDVGSGLPFRIDHNLLSIPLLITINQVPAKKVKMMTNARIASKNLFPFIPKPSFLVCFAPSLFLSSQETVSQHDKSDFSERERGGRVEKI